MTLPRATLRLQLHHDFTFDDALAHVDYFDALGVSHLYTSPVTTAQPGSMHGYDTVDYGTVSAELGGETALRRLSAKLHERGMGLVVDVVPNHMGVGGAHNAWWLDILEWGRHSAYARHFDVDWHSPDPALRGKVLMPFLGAPYGEELEAGRIELRFDAQRTRFVVAYGPHVCPICPADYAALLQSADRADLAALAASFHGLTTQPDDQQRAAHARDALREYVERNGTEPIDFVLEAYASADPVPRERLHKLLERQHYRLAWWRTATDEINWRRFFDVTALAGVRVERHEVFEAVHRLVFRLYADGVIDGVRIDHIDGLADPREYCERLRQRLASLRTEPPYIVVEKILAQGETLRDDWAVQGTTGYDFMNDVGALLHDAAGAEPLAAAWAAISGSDASFSEVVLDARREMLAAYLAAELDHAARALHRIAREQPATRDYTYASIHRSVAQLAIWFPVYRVYPVHGMRTATDNHYFDIALDGARRTLPRAYRAALARVDAWLGASAPASDAERPDAGAKATANAAGGADTTATSAASNASTRATAGGADRAPHATANANRHGNAARSAADASIATNGPLSHTLVAQRTALALFSQLTAPLAAKATEDTAFYRYGRLLSRNEVGADPGDFARTVEDFHAANQLRQRRFPHALLATATHDHKRGEDVRARLAVLSEIPDQWSATLRAWSTLNQPHRRNGNVNSPLGSTDWAPGPEAEAMLYQTLVGCWPPDLAAGDEAGVRALAERVAQWQLKALREAKRRTNWLAPDEAYEAGCRDFLFDILAPQRRDGFLHELETFVARIAPAGVSNSLLQTTLRITSPGVPDLYQGTELWDFSLVDPDNRRPVDYAQRAAALGDDPPSARLAQWRDARVKLGIVQRLLALRTRAPSLLRDGAYLPLAVHGEHAARVIAFARQHGDERAVVIGTRLATPLLEDSALPLVAADRWGDTAIELPPGFADARWHDWLSDASPTIPRTRVVAVRDVLAALPVAVLSNLAPKPKTKTKAT
ncbi:malto-oligosyltrehalose synthase [Paraburkholderia caballeronis]|uniref:(1->4)-alpha-D-glucan 1-alpha-D-glucosylmutase n=1 Tax=Paraburkholderia caballeronis TaxID=416943 RepID=A0A1H7KU50_9BURK|nr:malto-oligosyltrehalose synthase [Paraburkholderia caballeronis]PXW28169.1 (1->4)-alpha-D-glucan 1-alpha-D-glucosylmutase [Paraburkholderia caballeronis]PXX03535.1 (1->4)-alpha-D-glucan 1-alpha-D-glucosylmutase [Paraburkholderia caballeronis]RAK04279.1 (1->4)-alpha-D-glucan 1-alpha-D-glucosylmutase [Paraburkholderia caballeronis]SED86585.1 (1->4)-alpha-D-glucan 1-alpha-D-glucosylmutase [Paraburkholderia caballeronis]SEK90393.1 (1->4)-alpha-D-glucan 1-alpha-D-glucosylmutase [Paraburkholderia